MDSGVDCVVVPVSSPVLPIKCFTKLKNGRAAVLAGISLITGAVRVIHTVSVDTGDGRGRVGVGRGRVGVGRGVVAAVCGGVDNVASCEEAVHSDVEFTSRIGGEIHGHIKAGRDVANEIVVSSRIDILLNVEVGITIGKLVQHDLEGERVVYVKAVVNPFSRFHSTSLVLFEGQVNRVGTYASQVDGQYERHDGQEGSSSHCERYHATALCRRANICRF